MYFWSSAAIVIARLSYNLLNKCLPHRIQARLLLRFGQPPPPLSRPGHLSLSARNDFREQHEYTNNKHDDIDCAICIESIKYSQKCISTPCRHVFHTNCAMGWFKIKSRCPMCKAEILEHPGQDIPEEDDAIL